MRSKEEIEEMLEEVDERRHSYKRDGKKEALQWVLGESDKL